MKRILLVSSLGFLLAVAAAPSATAQLIRAYIVQDSVTVGDRLTLVVVAERGPEDVATFPTFDPRPGQAGGVLGDLVVFGPRSRGTTLLGVGYDYPVADTITFEVATFAIDSAFVPQIAVTVQRNGESRRATSDPFFFPVESLVSEDATALRDITPIASFRRNWLPLFLVLVGLALAALALRWWWQRPAPPAPPVEEPIVEEPVESAIAEATRRLDALEHAALASPPEQRAYYIELSDTLRTYLERKLSVPALESTTSELVHSLESSRHESGLTEDVVSDVRTVLTQSDLVKFAKHEIPEADSRATLGETRVLIMRVEDKAGSRQRELAEAARARAESNGQEHVGPDDTNSDDHASESDHDIDGGGGGEENDDDNRNRAEQTDNDSNS